ncbi:MAG: PEP/pyruvate-binding domain-containing protein [Candidatus Hodarchaeales archaeon]|jgi:pyruvate,water dikinase
MQKNKSKEAFIRTFSEISESERPFAGGKGGNLAYLHQKGFPVPDGFVIMSEAFIDDELVPEAWGEIQKLLTGIRRKNKKVSFAVRSSAKAEDSPRASFAGEFETVLDISTNDEIREAIQIVRNSRFHERVKAYSKEKGIDVVHEMPIVIQQLVQAEISGVLFTADPVTGNRMVMIGSFTRGYGDKLVSGEISGEDFSFDRPKGKYKGPVFLKNYSKKLYKLAERVEKEFNFPQDIEWCISSGKLFLLQSRPVSTLVGYDPVLGLWNASLTGDYLWSNVNIAEATENVMTPSTWSFNEILFIEASTTVMDGDCLIAGNICGKPYVNLSFPVSAFKPIGMNVEKSLGQYEETMGRIPNIPRIPLYPYRLRSLLKNVPANIKLELFGKKFIRNRNEFVASTPGKTQELIERISKVNSNEELLSLWNNDIYPYSLHSSWTLRFVMKSVVAPTTKLRRKLVKMVGEADANTLLSNLAGIEDQLVSLGPVLGIAQILDGELSEEEYMKKYGHRSPHETELYIPRPYEDPSWLDKKLEDFRKSKIDVKALLKKRQNEFDVTWERFKKKYPRKKEKFQKEIEKVTQATIDRELVRAEYIRFNGCVIRSFLLKVGQLTSLGEGVFFLTRDEVLNLLKGDDSSRAYIASRKATYEKYKKLPPYPAYIIGRFDPIEWAKDPNRRTDIYDSRGTPVYSNADGKKDVLKGSAGSMGRAEGYVRIIHSSDEGENLQSGEILVTTTTNIGWTLLFPKAAAIVTDVGAILSHATIVARELGIPAVVGCENATMRLRTGDRVLVDGGTGIVKILETIT